MCVLFAGRWSDNGFLMSEPSTELIFYQDTSSHHHVPPDQLLLNTATTTTHGRVGAAAAVGNVTAGEILEDLTDCRWLNPIDPTAAQKLVLRPGHGSVFSLTDTSPEYTAKTDGA